MELQLRKSFKLFHPLFLAINRRFRSPCTSLPSSHTQPCPFITCLPSRFLHSLPISTQPTSSLDIKLQLLHQESFSPSQVKLLQDNLHFLAASVERVSSLISLFRAKDDSGALVRTLLTRSPWLFKSRAENLELKCKFFEDLGLGSLGLHRLLTHMHTPAVLGTSLKTLQKHIDFLQRIGLSKKDVLTVITRHPSILFTNIDSKMEAAMIFFYRQGLSKHHFLRFARIHPQVFGCSIDPYLTKRVEFLRGLGLSFPSRKSARALIAWISLSPQRLLSAWGNLKHQGFSEAEILRMVLLRTEILELREDSITRKFDYLKNVLNRDVQEVTKFPGYLCLSLENRIIPRFTFLNELKERGQHAKKLSLKYLLTSSDEFFERRHASGYVKWKAEYQNKQEEHG